MSKVKSASVAVVLGLFWFCFQPEAQAEEENVIQMDQVVVTEHKEKEIPAYVQDVVPQARMEQPTMSGSVLDTIADQAGIQIRQGTVSGSGGGKLRLRGFDETRLKVLKDGVPIHRDGSYGNGPIDWSILAGDDVGRIEIHRGAGPAKFGDTLGGVINIITRKPPEKPETKISTAYGSLNTWDTKASHAWKKGPVGWRLTAGHYETDGYLRNNFDDRNHFGADLFFDLPSDIELGAGVAYSESQTGNPVYNRPDSPYFKSGDPIADDKELGGPGIGGRLLAGPSAWGDESKTEDENLALSAFVQKAFSEGRIRTDFRLWNQDRHEVFYDAADENKKIYERDTTAEDNNWLWQVDGSWQFDNHKLGAGGMLKHYGWGDQSVGYIDESYFNPSINFMTFIKEGFKGKPDLLSYSALYLQDEWRPHSKITLALGLRQEWFAADSVDPDAFGYEWEAAEQNMEEEHLAPRAAITARPFEDNCITVGIGKVYRYPTSPEYFWWYLNNGTDFFNTDLKAEEALQYEAGIEQTLLERLKIGVRGYYYDISKYISGTTMPGIGQVVYNIGQVKIKGVELSLSGTLPHNIKPWVNFTWQKGEKSDDPFDSENELTGEAPDLPDTIVNLGVDYAWSDIFSLRLWLNHVGERKHFSGQEIETFDAYTLVNFSASYRVWRTAHTQWDLMLSGENVFDESYEQQEGYPLPGAVFIGGVRLTL